MKVAGVGGWINDVISTHKYCNQSKFPLQFITQNNQITFYIFKHNGNKTTTKKRHAAIDCPLGKWNSAISR